MATGATIYRIAVNIADMNRHYYQQHDLTIAQHPSENGNRLMVRFFAFVLNAHEGLAFTKGLSVDDEPDIWLKSQSDELELWIELGQVDEKRIRKACGRSKIVKIYTYSDRKSEIWWQQIEPNLARYRNLQVYHLKVEGAETLLRRKMQLQCNIQDDELLVSDETQSITVHVRQRGT